MPRMECGRRIHAHHMQDGPFPWSMPWFERESSLTWGHPKPFVTYLYILGLKPIRDAISGLFNISVKEYPNLARKRLLVPYFVISRNMYCRLIDSIDFPQHRRSDINFNIIRNTCFGLAFQVSWQPRFLSFSFRWTPVLPTKCPCSGMLVQEKTFQQTPGRTKRTLPPSEEIKGTHLFGLGESPVY